MNLAPSLIQRSFDSVVHMTLDQQIRAVGVDADAGKIWAVADASQPAVEFGQIKVSAEKAGNDDHAGAIAMRHAKTVIDWHRMQQQNLSPKQRFGPNGGVGFRMRLG